MLCPDKTRICPDKMQRSLLPPAFDASLRQTSPGKPSSIFAVPETYTFLLNGP